MQVKNLLSQDAPPMNHSLPILHAQGRPYVQSLDYTPLGGKVGLGDFNPGAYLSHEFLKSHDLDICQLVRIQLSGQISALVFQA
jgi:hypothetical protein